jgi:hypothetical protein
MSLVVAPFCEITASRPDGLATITARHFLGNSNGDLQSFEWTTTGPGPRFSMIVHHDDAEREFAYDRESHIGKLDKGLDVAPKRGWTVVGMKDDWKTIYSSMTK